MLSMFVVFAGDAAAQTSPGGLRVAVRDADGEIPGAAWRIIGRRPPSS
jgi:hypothetical protein